MTQRLPGLDGTDAAEATVQGSLERVVFASEETGYSVVRLRVDGAREVVTAVGTLPGVQPGEVLRLTGRWVRDARYGRQFKVSTHVTLAPATLAGIERYLGSGMVQGLGRELARRLVAHFGTATLEVIEKQPERLTEVAGIGRVRAGRLTAAWAEQRGIREVMTFLAAHGVSPAFAARIQRRYGRETAQLLRENPYRLARDVTGIGFASADRIARRLGLAADSPHRVAAAVLHVLESQAGEGHLYATAPQLTAAVTELVEVPTAQVEAAVERLVAEREVVREATQAEAAIFPVALHAAERSAARGLDALLRARPPQLALDVERAISWFGERHGLRLAPSQQAAVRTALTARALVITGGPGTGKTTLIRAVVTILAAKKQQILLAAPTGRAARRLAEATGREAKTLHRLLEYSPKLAAFQRNADHPLRADLVVVDEVSMVDTPLLNHLVQALPPTARLLLVGDADQLPSVGPGQVLADLIASGRLPVVRLTEIFRQARESLIVRNAHRINRGEARLLEPGPAGGDFHFIEQSTPEEILATVQRLVTDWIPRRRRLDPVTQIQVLTPMRRGLLGTESLNAELQARLNAGGREVRRGGRILRVGDKVMQIRNNYDRDVFNGDLGRVTTLDEAAKELVVDFEGRAVRYDLSDLDELVLAYACTVHKSQGSEYPAVVIPLHTQHYVLLRRNLLYTAVTRGRQLVILVGTSRALRLAVRNDRVEVRRTRLAERLRAGVSERAGR